MSKTVYIRINSNEAHIIELEDGSYGLVAQVSEEEATRLSSLMIPDFVEGEDWKDCPSVWKKDGNPRTEYLGHNPIKVATKPPPRGVPEEIL